VHGPRVADASGAPRRSTDRPGADPSAPPWTRCHLLAGLSARRSEARADARRIRRRPIDPATLEPASTSPSPARALALVREGSLVRRPWPPVLVRSRRSGARSLDLSSAVCLLSATAGLGGSGKAVAGRDARRWRLVRASAIPRGGLPSRPAEVVLDDGRRGRRERGRTGPSRSWPGRMGRLIDPRSLASETGGPSRRSTGAAAGGGGPVENSVRYVPRASTYAEQGHGRRRPTD
jgi:hypothetical protein